MTVINKEFFMKALFSTILLFAIAVIMVVAQETRQSGQGATRAPRSPAATLTHPSTQTAIPDAEGFIRRWLLLEPIAANGLTDSLVQAAVKKEHFSNQLTVIPRDGDKVNVQSATLTWHAVDTKLYNVNLYHFAYALAKPTSNVLFWAVTLVDCPNELKDVRLAIGSNAASIWWINGEEVIGIYGDRQTVIDDGISKRITLRKGLNVVRGAIINAGGATDFCARFMDKNDAPVRLFAVNLSETPKWLVGMQQEGLARNKMNTATANSETEKMQFEPPKPALELIARFEVNLDAPILELGQVENLGNRRIIPITGGKFTGPRLNGTILNNGADWQMVAPDGLARLDTRYALRTDDGALIYIQTHGFRYGPAEVMAEVAKGNPVDPNKYFFRAFIQFETGSAQYTWLNRAMAIAAGMRLRNSVIYDAYLIK
jgi:hypothetical protein